MRLEFEFSVLPNTANNTSRTSNNWKAVAFQKKKMRDDLANRFWFELMRYPDLPVKPPWKHVDLTLTRRSSVRPDSDGLVSSFKIVVDALRQAKVIENDKYLNVGFPSYKWEKAPQKRGGIKIVVEHREGAHE